MRPAVLGYGKRRPGHGLGNPVQTHLNVLAVAALHDLSCVILPEGIKMEGASLEKAKEEGINILSSSLSAYEICGLMYANGIK